MSSLPPPSPLSPQPQHYFVSVGSNINREESIHHALLALEEAFAPITRSSLYESEAVGFTGENFYNLVVAFFTPRPYTEVNQTLARIEEKCGRVRTADRFSPRTLDLDLILVGEEVIQQPQLTIPRGEIVTNAFVLLPLAEIAPNLCHPLLRRSYRELWQEMERDNCQRLWKIPYP
ncbi:MAG: 2-amino-4-hydroxy-6-hydroxymethyldihydropteridine diphosphokinase [Gammaproteobacteria bacterium]|nr:2-amino-4-hydroxy-6-hydroxymethyldihydropteridine diphosphokinase [Gammaproteobacteria bacterium]